MEPVAASGALVRPLAGGGGPELSALLRHGRVLMAEVLASPGEGSLVLAIARHTVPAETELRLDPGQKFLVRVEERANGVVLRLLGASEDGAAALLRALRAVVGEERPLGELYGELVRALRAQFANAREAAPALRALAEGLARNAWSPAEASGAALRALLVASGLTHEGALAAVLAGRLARAALADVRDDLKALLLRAQGELGDGPVRDTVTRLLSSLEADQLLNLARARAGEPLVLAFPFPDGEQGWTTAQLHVPWRDGSEAEPEAADDGAFRLVLGLELSRLGPVRAELALGPRTLGVRLAVASQEVAERVRADLADLRARLGDGAREVALDVRVGAPAALAPPAPLDIRYLREHSLLDVVG